MSEEQETRSIVTASAPPREVMALLQEAAAVERELCAKLADAEAEHLRRFEGANSLARAAELSGALAAAKIAAQIRARGAPMKENGP